MKEPNTSLRRRTLVAAGLTAPLWPDIGLAQGGTKKPPAIRDFFRAPAISAMRLSPYGKFIAGLREVLGRRNINVVDLTTRKALIVTGFTDSDVFPNLRWVNNNRLLFTMHDPQMGGDDRLAGGLFAINRDASDFRQLAERGWVSEGSNLMPPETWYLSRIRDKGGFTDDVMVGVSSMQALGRFSSNLYRLNTVSGRRTLLTLGGPTDTVDWVVDRANVPRAAVSVRDGVTRVHFRESEQSSWRVIFEYGPEDFGRSVDPIDFDGAGNLHVSAYAGADNAAIYRYDHRSERHEAEPVAAVKGFDLGNSLIFSADGQQLVGVSYEAERAGTYWIDERVATWQAQVDNVLPDHVNSLQFTREVEGAPVLVHSYSDREPGRFYLFNPLRSTLELIAQARPWLASNEMRPTQFYRYAARDGLSIPAQLTLPVGNGKFPLVVVHYGGPWVRPIHWRWDESVQFLASRGYAVLMPAPRASTGFGAALYKAG